MNIVVKKDNDTYVAVRISDEGTFKKIQWLWGKTDFISFFAQEQKIWRCQRVCLMKNSSLYDFVETSHHGAMFEETRWVYESEEIYIELPIHFSHLMIEISNSLLARSLA
ncbi:MAG: hypothetical protein JJV97_02505 [SAR324 cluster bacterium]|nr:hypothetical protein [SAR324 cluster bacterium]